MKKILFIEDESALQRALTQVLVDQGYQVFSALDGENGILQAKKEVPDLILLDLILPRKDGFTVLEALKSDTQTKNIPVMILSNLESSTDLDRALALGATNYLVKMNYRIGEVVEKVKKILGE